MTDRPSPPPPPPLPAWVPAPPPAGPQQTPPPARATPAQHVAQTWSAGAQRTLDVEIGPARTALLQAIRALEFTVSTEQFGLLEAERGSRLRGLSLTRTRVPVALRIKLAPAESGCEVEVVVEDRWGGAGRLGAAVAVYAEVFTEVLTALDERLTRIDPGAAAGFGQWWRVLPEDQVSAGANGAAGAARLESTIKSRSSRLLDGPRTGPKSATAVARADVIALMAPDATAELDAEVLDGMLTAGQLIAATPGKMPPALIEHLRRVVLLFEQRLGEHRHAPAGLRMQIELETDDKPVVVFMHQQAALREKLPLRMLLTCTTCRLERVLNPDFLRARERSRRVKVLQTSVGAAFGAHQISPFILFGRLAQLKKTDPDYVCARCQGTDADEKPITFCSRCGERLDGSVLRTCPKCELDLRTLLGAGATPWREIEATVQTESPVVEAESVDDFGETVYSQTATMSPPTVPPPIASVVQPGWYADPWQRHEVRWFDGQQWTMHVGAGGVVFVDAPPR